MSAGTVKRGRPAAPIYGLAEAARLLDVPVEMVRRKLMAPGRSFFPSAWVDAEGVWWIPERELRRYMERGLEQLYSPKSASEWLEVSYSTVLAWIRRGRLAVVRVEDELRIRESALVGLMRARDGGVRGPRARRADGAMASGGGVSFFSGGKGALQHG